MADFYGTTNRNIRGIGFSFEWWGGPYIEVALMGHTASEVINVWDYSTDKPRIARTEEAFNAKVDDWIESYTEDSLVHDATVNW